MLWIAGDRDDFSSSSTLRHYFTLMTKTSPGKIRILEDANHFFSDRASLAELAEGVTAWLLEVLLC